MKIEVTFEKNTKKIFRQECISRLREFVKDIKSRQQANNQKYKEITKLRSIQEKNVKNFEFGQKNQTKDFLYRQNRDILLQQEMSKTVKKGELLVNVQKSNQLKKKASLQENSQEDNKFQSECHKVTLSNMRAQVDRVLQRLESSSNRQTSQISQLQSTVNSIDCKLNKLIQKIQSASQSQSLKYNSLSDQKFWDKFERLTQRFDQIKQKNIQKSKLCPKMEEQAVQLLTFRKLIQ